ncbi:MAG: PP2C family protein-serine/threonine phosphatase [Pirellulales bacterium]
MSKQIPSYLKLVTDTSAESTAAVSDDLAAMTGVARAFEQATGWRLEIDSATAPCELSSLMWSAPVNPGVGIAPGHIRLISPCDTNRTDKPRCPIDDASPLAAAVGKLWGELLATRHALWQREAELATGIPLLVREDEHTPSLGERLEAVLRGGAEALDCDAAALYLLDSATTELKLRSSWGLPRKRLAEPARPLRGALGDLEALLGHAVVLADAEMHDYWKVPEAGFAACACVPVSSPTIPLGTLWVFSREPRDFSDSQTNILEVVAGRIASDLEREVLVDEAILSREQSRQVVAARQSQWEQLPTIAPVIEGWDVAAHGSHARSLGGAFHDWFALDDNSLAIVAGDTSADGVGGALVASALRATARALAPERAAVEHFLEKANAVLWSGSADGQSVGALQAIISAGSPLVKLAAAGPLRVVSIARGDVAPLCGPSTPLGWEEPLAFAPQTHKMAAGELLIVYGTGALGPDDAQALDALDLQLAARLHDVADRPASELVELAGDVLADQSGCDLEDRVLVVIKRAKR